jgi:hypothetical protein
MDKKYIQSKSFNNRLCYDNCAYKKALKESVGSYKYQMAVEKYENTNKCVFDKKFTRPYDASIIDVESNLMNISESASKCAENKYSPYRNDSTCISTYNKKAPVVIPAEICPITMTNDGRGVKYGSYLDQ